MAKVLLTGGAGFIGSHTLAELLDRDYEVAVVDNLCNSCEEALRRVKKITGRNFKFYSRIGSTRPIRCARRWRRSSPKTSSIRSSISRG